MASINFYAGPPYQINNINGSGLAFFGNAFGQSVQVGSWNEKTFVSSSNGTTDGGECQNIQFYNSASGSINGGSPVHLKQIPNYLATLKVEFTHDTPVKTQNCKLRIYDRSNINNDPSGTSVKVYETIHPTVSQVLNGSGSDSWSTPHGSSVIMDLISSPGLSGLRPNGINTTSNVHDHYICLSLSPDSIGQKNQVAMWVSMEFL